jgi:hypothetical protein
MENCLFWNIWGGSGDAMNAFIECVALSKKIYI